jgi:hypothetical protein
MQAKAAPRTFESYEQAGGGLRATFGAWADELSDEEHDAIRYYASPAYKTLNLALRERRALDRDLERHAEALDRALRVPLPEPVIAYRGVELERPVDFTARAGQPLVFRAYVSTSLLRPIAEGFCALAATKHHAVLFETVLAAGTRVGCPDLVQPTLEAELLLPRRQPLLLGEALPPAPGRRYWTVKLQASKRPVLEESSLGDQHPAERRLRDRRLAAPRTQSAVTPGPRRPTGQLPRPSRGPSIGR